MALAVETTWSKSMALPHGWLRDGESNMSVLDYCVLHCNCVARTRVVALSRTYREWSGVSVFALLSVILQTTGTAAAWLPGQGGSLH